MIIMNKFYIGQKIVAIKDHSQGIFKKGDEFVVLGIEKGCCVSIINVGILNPNETNTCTCGGLANRSSFRFFATFMFAPIELSTTTFEDVIKQYEPCLN